MTVPAQIPVTSSFANGVTTSFPYTFKILDADDLSVSVDGEVITIGYSITGIGQENGGFVVFDAPPANGLKVIRYLDPDFKRLTDYQQFGDWIADIVNGDFDRIWLALQFLSQSLVRTLQLPVDTITQQEITQDASERAGKLVGFDVNGDLTLSAVADLDLTTVTDFISNFLATNTEPDARAAIAAAGLGSNQFTGIQKFSARVALTISSTINLSTGNSNTYTGVGTGTVSAAVLDNGSWAIVTYPAGVTLQYSSTTQRLNTGGANYVTEANDVVFYYGLNGVVAGFIVRSSGKSIVDNIVNASNDSSFSSTSPSISASPEWVKGLINRCLVLRHQETSGTDGGSISATTWTKRPLTIDQNGISGASVSSGNVTLPAGTYSISGYATSKAQGNHRCRVRNTSGTTVSILGSSTRNGADQSTPSLISEKIVTLTATTVLVMEHWRSTSQTGDGLGAAVGSGDPEVYAELSIRKIA